jgi:hypothetical protein
MRQKICGILSFAVICGFWVPMAHAGVIRYTGKKVAEGASGARQVAASSGAALAGGSVSAGHAATNATRNGVTAAAGGVAAAGAVAGGAIAGGASGAAHGVKMVPADVAGGAQSVARKFWHVLW